MSRHLLSCQFSPAFLYSGTYVYVCLLGFIFEELSLIVEGSSVLFVILSLVLPEAYNSLFSAVKYSCLKIKHFLTDKVYWLLELGEIWGGVLYCVMSFRHRA